MGFWATFYGLATLVMMALTSKTENHYLQRVGLMLFATWVLSNWIAQDGGSIQSVIVHFATIDLFGGVYTWYLWRECRYKVLAAISALFCLMATGHVAALLSDNVENAFSALSIYLNVLYLMQLCAVSIGSIIEWVGHYGHYGGIRDMHVNTHNTGPHNFEGTRRACKKM